MQVIEAAQRAERIKAVMPQLAVSADALFIAIVLGRRKAGRPKTARNVAMPSEPPEWFTQALADLKGRAMTIGKFVILAGQYPSSMQQKVAIGRWLRASGRMPRKRGGNQVFDI